MSQIYQATCSDCGWEGSQQPLTEAGFKAADSELLFHEHQQPTERVIWSEES